LDADIAFGADATGLVEDRLAGHLLAAWSEGRSALYDGRITIDPGPVELRAARSPAGSDTT
ncbi:iron-containing redox enzyme family protein, partial [Streptomyces sp. NPDC056670]